MRVIQELTYDIWDIKSVAKELQQYMKINQKKEEKEAA
jgi:hypothetical protein